MPLNNMKNAKKRNFKYKISVKLTLYFTVAILLFSIVISSVFTVLFYNYTESLYHDKMTETARSVSAAVTGAIYDGKYGAKWEAFADDFYHNYGGDKPYGSVYLDGPRLIKFVKEITDADVWLIDSKYTILTTSQDSKTEYSSRFVFKDLPMDTKAFIYTVCDGKGNEVYADRFSKTLGDEYLTMGVPLYTPRGEVTGAVLLHTPKSELSEAFDNGMFILFISTLLAFAIGVLISVIISRTIAKPLKKINKTAIEISEGNYSAKTDVKGTDEIAELAQTMDEMGDKLRQAEIESEKLQKMRQDFVANISHELRTPVTVIRGSLEAICDNVVTDPEMVAEYHRQLLGESIYMQRLVNDLLDLSRLQNPDFSINITEFNLCDCLSDAVRSGRRIASDKNINIEFSSDETVYIFNGDYDRIRQMLLIIIDNAIKFTDNPENAVRIELKENTVTVTNIGIGIKNEDLPMVFERFYKSRSEKNKNGTGLGLAIAKQIAARHGIDVSVTSIEGGETTFGFVFPPKM